MKNNLKRAHTLKLIASHSLVAAIVSQPYVVSIFSDLLNITLSGGESAATVDNLLNSLFILSSTALVIALVAFFGYLLGKRK